MESYQRLVSRYSGLRENNLGAMLRSKRSFQPQPGIMFPSINLETIRAKVREFMSRTIQRNRPGVEMER